MIARPFSQAESGAGVGSGGRALLSVDRATIYRCDADFAQKRALLSLLCGENDREAMYLSESDVDRFVRTVLPQLVSRQENEVGRSVDAIGASAGPNAEDGSAASSVFDRLVPPAGRETGVPAHGGLIIDVPPELLAKMRVPCRLAFYLDRDRAGVTCDAQAHYGDKHYHVFDGIGVDASMRDKEMERLCSRGDAPLFPAPVRCRGRHPRVRRRGDIPSADRRIGGVARFGRRDGDARVRRTDRHAAPDDLP